MINVHDLRKLRQVDFLTIEQDFEKILDKFLNNQNLLKLLYYNTPDALDKSDITENEVLIEIASRIKMVPDLQYPKERNSFLIITFDNFSPNATNPEFIDNNIFIDILCPIEFWQMDTYMSRPFRLMHEVQKTLDKTKLNGIGVVNFVGANILNLGEYAGYQVAYSVTNNV